MATYSVHLAGNLAAPQGAPSSVHLAESDFVSRKALGKALRKLNVMPPRASIRVLTIVGHDAFVSTSTLRRPIELKRTDVWSVIGRGQAGWHACRPDCSSSGGTLEAMSGFTETNSYWGSPASVGKPWHRAGYVSEAAEGCRVYDASNAPAEAFIRHVIGGPMLNPALADDACDRFNKQDQEAALRMMPGLSGGFETVAAHGIASAPEQAPQRKYSSLDRVGWGIYRGLLEALGGVRFGVVRRGKVVWEDETNE